MTRPRLYCAVYACMNSSILKPEISYFKLPADEKRRSKWLRLIAREDLANKPPVSYTVCEEHFNVLDVLPGTYRKRLKANSLPSLLLPELTLLGIKEKQMTTEVPTLVEKCVQTDETCVFLPEVQIKIERTNNDEKCVQTDETCVFLPEVQIKIERTNNDEKCVQTEENITPLADACTQTPTSLSSNAPRKRKLKYGILESRKRNKEQETEKYQREMLHKLCDRLLTKELAEMVKAQTH